MFGLGKHGPDGRYGAIVDIGSGSVGVALVASDPLEKNPEILWSYRERMTVLDSETQTHHSKYIATALLNAMLALGSDGLKVLREHEREAKVNVLQVTISAPWSYTIAKTISHSKDSSFYVTEDLISNLINTAQEEALKMIDENGIIEKLGLETITKATIHTTVNGYITREPFNKKAKSLSISHVSALSQKHVLAALQEAHEKVIPKSKMHRYSFMIVFYYVMRKLAVDTSEVCLVDVTSEATEIAIVRDGILKYVTHAPFGMYTIARDIAALCDIPKEEALSYIRQSVNLKANLSDSKQKELHAIVTTYEEKISDLFKRTGDSLAIPRTIFLHTDVKTEPFFAERIKNAALLATKSDHNVHLVTTKLLLKNEEIDTALLLSSYFFHKMSECKNFKQTQALYL